MDFILWYTSQIRFDMTMIYVVVLVAIALYGFVKTLSII